VVAKVWDEKSEQLVEQRIETTIGRVKFNEILPDRLRFVNRSLARADLRELISRSFQLLGKVETALLADGIKRVGFEAATRGGISISVFDIAMSMSKKALINAAEEKISKIGDQFSSGLLTGTERNSRTIEIWQKATKDIGDAMMAELNTKTASRDPQFHPILMMANSGARGNKGNLEQLGGMRGMMADPSGTFIEVPVKSNFREGMNVLEYFISTHGARKGLADTALRTADSGYLTRRLVDVAQDVIVRIEDCGTSDSASITLQDTAEITGARWPQVDGDEDLRDLRIAFARRVLGRFVAKTIDCGIAGQISAGEEVSEEHAEKIIAALNVDVVAIRSPLTCAASIGICQVCYGRDLTTNRLVDIGTSVGIMAAQSIGEPGTQLTMRTFHTGGISKEEYVPEVATDPNKTKFEFKRNNNGDFVAVLDPNGAYYEVEEIKGARKFEVGLHTDLSTNINEKFDQNLDLLKQFVMREGHARVKPNHMESGSPLGAWVRNVKSKVDQLKQERIAQLVELGLSLTQAPAKQGKAANQRSKAHKFVEVERSLESDVKVNPTGRWYRFDKLESVPNASGSDRYSRTSIKVPLQVKRKELVDVAGNPIPVRPGLDPDELVDKIVWKSMVKQLTGSQGELNTRTSGLPRVEELFEARSPRGKAEISRIDGVVEVVRSAAGTVVEISHKGTYDVELDLPIDFTWVAQHGEVVAEGQLIGTSPTLGDVIAPVKGTITMSKNGSLIRAEDVVPPVKTPISHDAKILVRSGDLVRAGDPLTDGPLDPQEILEVKGRAGVQNYIVKEVQKVYRSQGVTISDKHIEIIVRQLLRKVRVDNPGDTHMLPTELADRLAFERENARVLAEGGEPATAAPQLLGVTKASLNTESFLAAASFQETTRVLTEAAITGARDYLVGLKENVIIGKLIPAGTGAPDKVAARKEAEKLRAAAALAGGDLPTDFGKDDFNVFLESEEGGASQDDVSQLVALLTEEKPDAEGESEANPFLADAAEAPKGDEGGA
jgi:DNA-directed RNA polymerase subunit beta'